MEDITVSLKEVSQDDISEVRVDGVIDTITATELESVIDSLVKRNRYRIIVDLAGVDYISSAGWGIFISQIRDIRAHSGDIKLANLIPNVYEIYDLLEFDNVINAYSSVDDARSDFSTIPTVGGAKKKDQEAIGIRVIDEVGASAVGFDSVSSSSDSIAPVDFETGILALIKDDPFYTISEIAAILSKPVSAGPYSWWQVFSVMRRRGLLTRRSRFRLFRKR